MAGTGTFPRMAEKGICYVLNSLARLLFDGDTKKSSVRVGSITLVRRKRRKLPSVKHNTKNMLLTAGMPFTGNSLIGKAT